MHDLCGVASVGIVARGPLDEYRFNMFMRDLLAEKSKDIFRCKGVLAVHVRRGGGGGWEMGEGAACEGGAPEEGSGGPEWTAIKQADMSCLAVVSCLARFQSPHEHATSPLRHGLDPDLVGFPPCPLLSPAGLRQPQVCVPGCARDHLLRPQRPPLGGR